MVIAKIDLDDEEIPHLLLRLSCSWDESAAVSTINCFIRGHLDSVAASGSFDTDNILRLVVGGLPFPAFFPLSYKSRLDYEKVMPSHLTACPACLVFHLRPFLVVRHHSQIIAIATDTTCLQPCFRF